MNAHDLAMLTAGAVAEGYLLLLIWFICELVGNWRMRRDQQASAPAKSED